MSDGIRVRVLESATFNGPDHKALPWAEEGDYIVIAGGDYAQWLRENGLVVFADTDDERKAVEQQIADLEAHMQALATEQEVLNSFKTENSVEQELEDEFGNEKKMEESDAEVHTEETKPARRGRKVDK